MIRSGIRTARPPGLSPASPQVWRSRGVTHRSLQTVLTSGRFSRARTAPLRQVRIASALHHQHSSPAHRSGNSDRRTCAWRFAAMLREPPPNHPSQSAKPTRLRSLTPGNLPTVAHLCRGVPQRQRLPHRETRVAPGDTGQTCYCCDERRSVRAPDPALPNPSSRRHAAGVAPR